MSTDNSNKKEILSQETMFPLFDQAYNLALDHAIESIKNMRLPDGWTQLDDFKALINIILSQLKKPSTTK